MLGGKFEQDSCMYRTCSGSRTRYFKTGLGNENITLPLRLVISQLSTSL